MLLKDVKILTWTEAQFQTHSQIKGIDGSSFIFNRVQRKAMAKGCETHLTYWYWWYMHCSFLCSLTSSLQNCKCLESWRHFFQRCCKTEKALESGKLGFAFWLFHLPVMTFLVSSSVNWIQSLCWMSFFPFLLLLSLASGADLKDLNVVLSLWLLAEFNQWQQKVIGEREKSLSSSVALLPQLWLALHKNTAHSGWPIPYSFKHGVTMNIPKAKTYMCNHSLFVSLTLLAPL